MRRAGRECNTVHFSQSRLNKRKAESNCSSWAEIVIEGGPLTLQIGNVTAPSIKIAMMRLPDYSIPPLKFVIEFQG